MSTTVGEMIAELSAYREDALLTFATKDGELSILSIYDNDPDGDDDGNEVVIDLGREGEA